VIIGYVVAYLHHSWPISPALAYLWLGELTIEVLALWGFIIVNLLRLLHRCPNRGERAKRASYIEEGGRLIMGRPVN
jgi:hypothetical protein